MQFVFQSFYVKQEILSLGYNYSVKKKEFGYNYSILSLYAEFN